MIAVPELESIRASQPRLYEAVSKIVGAVNAGFASLGIDPGGSTLAPLGESLDAPLPLNGISVVAANGIYFIILTPNPGNGSGELFFLESSLTSNFASVTVYPLGVATTATINLGNQTLYWRARSKYPSSPYSGYLLFGAPTAVVGGFISNNLDEIADGVTYERLRYGLTLAPDVPYNGDFEQFPDNKDTADGWTKDFEISGVGSYGRSSTPFQGSYAQELRGGNAGVAVASRPFGVKAGAKYTFQCRAKINDASSTQDGFYFRILFYDSDATLTRAAAISFVDIVAGTANFFTVADTYSAAAGEVLVPSTAKFARMALYGWTEPGAARTITVDTVRMFLSTLDLDNAIVDGLTFFRPMSRASWPSLQNPDFEWGGSTPAAVDSGWRWGGFGNQNFAYDTTTVYLGLRSLKATGASGAYTPLFNRTTFVLTPGDTLLARGAFRTSASGVKAYSRITFLDKDGVFVDAAYVCNAEESVGAWTYREVQKLVPTNSVYAYWELGYHSASTANGDCWFDACQALKVANLDTDTIDGLARRARTGAHSTYRPLSNPLTGSDNGTTALVSIAPFTMRIAGVDVSVGSGSTITLSFDTLYFIYYDDPNLAGGSVSFSATTVKETALNNNARFFVGSIWTPQDGGPDTVGNNDGGSTPQIGFTSRFLPARSTIVTQVGNATITTVQNVMDGRFTTKCTISMTANGGTNELTLVLDQLPGLTRPYKTLKGNIFTEITSSGTGGRVLMEYRLAGTGAWTTIYDVIGSTRAKQIDPFTLGNFQNLGRLEFSAFVRTTAAGPYTLTLDFYLAWVEGVE